MSVDLRCGDCRNSILPDGAVITDPPYPNGEGHFGDFVEQARQFLKTIQAPVVMVFWSELERPPVEMPLVAVHIWHRTNVNGKIYEPIYHFAQDGIKRRSEIKQHAAVFNGVGPGCNEYAGHPTQKPVALMRWLIRKCKCETIIDPYMGSGTTGVAAVELGYSFWGSEISPTYFEIAQRRIQEAQMQLSLPMVTA